MFSNSTHTNWFAVYEISPDASITWRGLSPYAGVISLEAARVYVKKDAHYVAIVQNDAIVEFYNFGEKAELKEAVKEAQRDFSIALAKVNETEKVLDRLISLL